MADIDIGQISEALNDKVDRNMRNVDTSVSDSVIAWQVPTAENDYTWYRKYASGWVEQGGIIMTVTGGQYAVQTAALPITMSDTNYSIIPVASFSGAGDTSVTVKVDYSYTTTSSIGIRKNWTSTNGTIIWQVSGMAA